MREGRYAERRRRLARGAAARLYRPATCPPAKRASRTGGGARAGGSPPPRRRSCSPLAAAVAGHAALWWTVCGRLEEGFAAWAAQPPRRGLAGGAWTAPVRGGWPFAATLTLPGVRAARPAPAPAGRGRLAGGGAWCCASPRRGSTGWRWRRPAATASTWAARRCASPPTAWACVLPLEAGAMPPRRGVSSGARAALRHAGRRRGGPRRVARTRRAAGGSDGRRRCAFRPRTLALPPDLPGTERLGRVVERIGLDLLLAGPPRTAAIRPGGRRLGAMAAARWSSARWTRAGGEVAASASASLPSTPPCSRRARARSGSRAGSPARRRQRRRFAAALRAPPPHASPSGRSAAPRRKAARRRRGAAGPRTGRSPSAVFRSRGCRSYLERAAEAGLGADRPRCRRLGLENPSRSALVAMQRLRLLLAPNYRPGRLSRAAGCGARRAAG